MRTVREVFSLSRVRGDVGIEIEVEGYNLPNSENTSYDFQDTWRIEYDGSLRGESHEYVLSRPCVMNDLSHVLGLLSEAYDLNDTDVNDTVRAGVHIHLNVQHLNMLQLFTFFTLYLVFEEVLTTYCGDGRKGNHFCLRASDAEYLIFYLCEIANNREPHRFRNENLRYSAMNITSLPRYGSVEFRALRSTRDLNRIEIWARILNRLLQYSGEFNNPRDVIDFVVDKQGRDVLQQVLGEYSTNFSMPDEELNELLYLGVKKARDLSRCNSWYNFDF